MAHEARNRGNTLATSLASATAILAVAVLAWLVLVDPPTPPIPTTLPTPEQIADAVSKRLAEDGYLKKEAFDQRMGRLDEAVSTLLTTDGFQRAVAELKRSLQTLQSCCGARSTPSGGRQPRIWVVFENAKLDDDPTGTLSAIARLKANSPGIVISEDQRARLDQLAAALRACATPERWVRLNIQGYSSTREFLDAQGQPMPDSEVLNVVAANLRAEGVVDHLSGEGLDAGSSVEVLHVPWQNYTDIRRPFLDSPDGVKGTDQEQLNRAVLVEVQDAGACAVEAASGGAR